MPETSEPSTLTKAFSALSAMGDAAKWVSDAMTKDVNGTDGTVFEKSKEPADSLHRNAGSEELNAGPKRAVELTAEQREANRGRGRLKRIMSKVPEVGNVVSTTARLASTAATLISAAGTARQVMSVVSPRA
jgi:hypothetical protein